MTPELPISPEDWTRTPLSVRALVLALWKRMHSVLSDLTMTVSDLAQQGEAPASVRRGERPAGRPALRQTPATGGEEGIPEGHPSESDASEVLAVGEGGRRPEGRDGRAAGPTLPVQEPSPVDEQEVEALYRRACSFVEEVMLAAREERPFSLVEAYAIVSRIGTLEGATDLFYRRAIYAREPEGGGHGFNAAVVLHSVNVCIYALRVGEGMGFARRRRIDLGVAALLHDIGMARLPDALIEKKGKFSDQELGALRQHPHYGRQILHGLGEEFRWLAEIALQEHERDDGSGYPEGLKGGQIHEYARIIAVADCFAGLTRSRPDRRGMMPFEAVRFIIQNQRSQLHQKVIKVLVAKLTAFPLKTDVRLNSGAVGRVVETHETHPLRPTVMVLYDTQGNPIVPPRLIDLRQMPILHIAEVIY